MNIRLDFSGRLVISTHILVITQQQLIFFAEVFYEKAILFACLYVGLFSVGGV